MKPDKVSDESWQFLTRFLDASNSSLIITDARAPDHPIVFANAAFERATGYGAQDVLGRNCRFLQNADREQPDLAVVRGALASGEACECLLRNYRKDGRMFWNKLYLFPFREEGELVLFVGVQHDVTLEQVLYATLEETLAERAQLIDILHDKTTDMAQLSLDLIQAQETERRQVARELHDELVGLVRDMSASPRPASLDQCGLEITVRDLLARELQAGPAWVFAYAGLPPRLPLAVEISVFHVVQESVTNILRHARAHKVAVEIKDGADKTELALVVGDDGVGFDASRWPEHNVRSGNVGLAGVRERVALLGGSLHIDSAPGAGTRITVTIPLDAPGAAS